MAQLMMLELLQRELTDQPCFGHLVTEPVTVTRLLAQNVLPWNLFLGYFFGKTDTTPDEKNHVPSRFRFLVKQKMNLFLVIRLNKVDHELNHSSSSGACRNLIGCLKEV